MPRNRSRERGRGERHGASYQNSGRLARRGQQHDGELLGVEPHPWSLPKVTGRRRGPSFASAWCTSAHQRRALLCFPRQLDRRERDCIRVAMSCTIASSIHNPAHATHARPAPASIRSPVQRGQIWRSSRYTSVRSRAASSRLDLAATLATRRWRQIELEITETTMSATALRMCDFESAGIAYHGATACSSRAVRPGTRPCSRPVLALPHVTGPNFQWLSGSETRSRNRLVLLLRHVEEELEHDAAVARPCFSASLIESYRSSTAPEDHRCARSFCAPSTRVNPHDQDLLVVAAVPHADPAALGRLRCTRHRKSWSSSSRSAPVRECLRADRVHARHHRRIVPSLPAASSAWNTSRTLYRSFA